MNTEEPDPSLEPASTAPQPPVPPQAGPLGNPLRTWPSLLAPVLTIPAALVVSAFMLVAAMLTFGGGSVVDQEAVLAFATSPLGIGVALAGTAIVFLLAAVVPARLSHEPAMARLGLVSPRMSWWAWPALLLGTFAVRTASVIGGAWLTGPPSESVLMLQRALERASGATAVAFVIAISVVPGVVEELFFRGYVQRGVLRRLTPALGIGYASLMFALAHGDPQYVVLVFPIGAWLGLVAWWTGSVWPGIACHAFNNAVLGVLGVLVEADMSDWGTWSVENVLGFVGCVVAAVGLGWVSWRWGRFGGRLDGEVGGRTGGA